MQTKLVEVVPYSLHHRNNLICNVETNQERSVYISTVLLCKARGRSSLPIWAIGQLGFFPLYPLRVICTQRTQCLQVSAIWKKSWYNRERMCAGSPNEHNFNFLSLFLYFLFLQHAVFTQIEKC